jgi:hypothetical protein
VQRVQPGLQSSFASAAIRPVSRGHPTSALTCDVGFLTFDLGTHLARLGSMGRSFAQRSHCCAICSQAAFSPGFWEISAIRSHSSALARYSSSFRIGTRSSSAPSRDRLILSTRYANGHETPANPPRSALSPSPGFGADLLRNLARSDDHEAPFSRWLGQATRKVRGCSILNTGPRSVFPKEKVERTWGLV